MEKTSPTQAQNALQLSQRAPIILAKTRSANKSFPLSLFSSADSPETWIEVEQLFYACLRTGDDKSAHLCLDRLARRFGDKNERIMAMKGLYQEAVAEKDEDLVKILQDYNQILKENPMNVPVHKRRYALLRSMGRPQEAIPHLCDFLEAFPTDPEVWCELSDLYLSQGMGLQAIYCLEEALLIVPNAWNLHARLGELEYMVAISSEQDADAPKHLSRAVQRFSRSIELCEDYVRAYCGLKLTTAKLSQNTKQSRSSDSDIISADKARKLNDLADSKLQQLVKSRSRKPPSGQIPADVIAAQELLSQTKK